MYFRKYILNVFPQFSSCLEHLCICYADARGCLAWTSLGIILFLRSLYSKFMCPSISLSLFLCVYVCVCAHVHVVMVPVKAQESYSVGVWTMRARESVREHRNAGAGCVSAPELKVDLFCTVHFAAVSNFLSRNSLCDVTVAL